MILPVRFPRPAPECPAVHRSPLSLAVLAPGPVVAACGDGAGPGRASLDCTGRDAHQLWPWASTPVIDPPDVACVRLPAAGAAGRSTCTWPAGAPTAGAKDGASAPYRCRGGSRLRRGRQRAPSAAALGLRRPAPPRRFHDRLRARERALSAAPGVAASRRRISASRRRSARRCSGRSAPSRSAPTACVRQLRDQHRHGQDVGQRVAIFVDDAAPDGGYTQADLDNVGTCSTTTSIRSTPRRSARESDIDGNGVVIVLLTHGSTRSARLQPPAASSWATSSALDLLPEPQPAPTRARFSTAWCPDRHPRCTSRRGRAVADLPGVFIHEFQHMISFNQHVLVRGGTSEDTWLNEGLSHFAEELGGGRCPTRCATDVRQLRVPVHRRQPRNAFDYLSRSGGLSS